MLARPSHTTFSDMSHRLSFCFVPVFHGDETIVRYFRKAILGDASYRQVGPVLETVL
jgi:hypothetical protein